MIPRGWVKDLEKRDIVQQEVVCILPAPILTDVCSCSLGTHKLHAQRADLTVRPREALEKIVAM